MSTTAVGPRKERFESLDALRGFAILGILLVNVEAFAMTYFEFQNPGVLGPLDAADATVWATTFAFFQFKFITIFSALFGAGIVLFAGEERLSPKRPFLRRRLFWLLLFGMIHNYLIWYGDILVPYAIAGLIGAAGRRWSARTLVIAGGGFLILGAALMALQTLPMAWLAENQPDVYAQTVKQSWAPPAETVQALQAALAGSLPERLAANAQAGLMFQIFQAIFLTPRTLGVMWIGMALLKSGFFTARWPLWSYLALTPLAAVGAWFGWGAGQQLLADNFEMSKFGGPMMTLYGVSLIQALGYAAIVMALVKTPINVLLHPFKAAGRMAFSNYILSSVVSVTVFWGTPGFGLIGTFSHVEQLQYVLVMWAVMLVWSTIWMRIFSIGPLEWVWRTLTYKKAIPMRRGAPEAVPGG